MRCDILAVEGRMVGFACGGGRRPSKDRKAKCRFCKAEAPETDFRLCDYILGGVNAATCDAPMCKDCALVIGPNEDLCPMHVEKADIHQRRKE